MINLYEMSISRDLTPIGSASDEYECLFVIKRYLKEKHFFCSYLRLQEVDEEEGFIIIDYGDYLRYLKLENTDQKLFAKIRAIFDLR